MGINKEEQAGRYSYSGRDKRRRTGRKVRAERGSVVADLVPEKHLQRAAEDYLQARGLRYIHVSDLIGRLCGCDSRMKTWERAELAYRFKGVPDLCIFNIGKRYPNCIVIELKVGKNSLTTDQREWMRDLYGSDESEWPAWVVCRTIDGFISAIDCFLAHCDLVNGTLKDRL